MKIIDTFTFFNELDVLELRLNILYESVDMFVLVEATKSHQNNSKPLYFKDNLERFKQFLPKIKHVVVDTFPEHTYWSYENYQRDCIYNTVKDIAHNNDIVFISDLDEIWNPKKLLPFLNEVKPNKIYRWKSLICYFYFNLVASQQDWIQPMFMRFSLLKSLLEENKLTLSHDVLRNQSQKLDPSINVNSTDYCGWHFSYTESPTHKLQNFLHSEYKNLSEEYIKECIQNKINPFHKNQMYLIEPDKLDSYLPEFVSSNIEKYQKYIIQ
jgi:beta-1,4-mannosyl-glycoprotein beta-1,4-N-acetylglucosaminyltransferase